MHADWQSFLETQSADISDGLLTGFHNTGAGGKHADNENMITDLSHLDVLQVSGADAVDFLHGQLSSDVAALDENEIQHSSWCNIKGRVIVSFLLYRNHDYFYLLLEKEKTEAISKRLQMFVLRSDVLVKNRSDDLIRIGIRGASIHEHLQPDLDSEPASRPSTILQLQGLPRRSILLCEIDEARQLWQKLSTHGACVAPEQWHLCDMEAGIPWVGKSGSEEFLPQSLNLDLLGGLSFDKGCYPGQEIIARMHFRGKLKQRMFLCSSKVDQVPATATKLFADGVKQHIGMVVNARLSGPGNCIMLIVLDLEHRDSALLHLASEDGPQLKLRALPYRVM